MVLGMASVGDNFLRRVLKKFICLLKKRIGDVRKFQQAQIYRREVSKMYDFRNHMIGRIGICIAKRVLALTTEEEKMKRTKRVHRDCRAGQAGFSLIEVLTVIAIIGVVSAIATPNVLRYRENSRLRAAASETLSLFRSAQIQAVKRNYNTCLIIDPAAGSITSFADDGSGGGTANDSVQNGDEPTLSTLTVPVNVTLPSGAITFTGNQTGFTPAGLPLNMGRMEIVSSSDTVQAEYRITLSIAGHTSLLVSTDGGSSWQ